MLCWWGSNLHGLSGIPTHLSDPQLICPCPAGTHTHTHLLSMTLQLVNTPSVSIPMTSSPRVARHQPCRLAKACKCMVLLTLPLRMPGTATSLRVDVLEAR